MFIIIGSRRLKSIVEAAVTEAEAAARRESDGIISAIARHGSLSKQISELTIDRDRKVEEFTRREREIEHKIGLERKRQEFEIEQAKRETSTTVREENLKADKERFKAEMDFQRNRLEGEVESLRALVQKMMERLPSAEIYADLTAGRRR